MDFARGQNQEQRNVWEIQCGIEYMLSTTYGGNLIHHSVFLLLRVVVAGSFGINRIEKRRRTFDKSKMYLSTYEFFLSKLKNVFIQIGVAGIFVSKRIENGGRTFDKGKVGMLIIVFRFAENTKGETDFIRAEV